MLGIGWIVVRMGRIIDAAGVPIPALEPILSQLVGGVARPFIVLHIDIAALVRFVGIISVIVRILGPVIQAKIIVGAAIVCVCKLKIALSVPCIAVIY